jgi:hypothetical protein
MKVIDSQRHLMGLILGLEMSANKEPMSALVWKTGQQERYFLTNSF